MSITVNWPAVPNATGYVLYRNAGSPVNLGSPPADKVDVAADSTTYTYTSYVNNTLYYIVVGAKNPDGSVTYSEQIPMGYYPDTGPGPQSLLRGDWSFGYFGEVSAFELQTGPELYTAFLNQAGSGAIQPNGNLVISTYHKCIVNGRIVFFPDNSYSSSTTTPALMMLCKLIVPDTDYVNKGIVVSKNGYDYIARAPHGTPDPIAGIIPSTDTIYLSELAMVTSLFGTSAAPVVPFVPGVTGVAKYRLADVPQTPYTGAIWSTALGATGGSYVYGTPVTGVTVNGNASNARPYVVLELLF